MKLVSISIEKLFGQFDYTIEFNQKENITILTGPNGYGKTTILNIIWSLFTGGYADTKLFSNIIFSFSDGEILEYGKNRKDKFANVFPVYFIKDQRIEPFDDALKQLNERRKNGSYINPDQTVEFLKHYKHKIISDSMELNSSISATQRREREISDKLNATYAERLFGYKTPMPEDEFEERFQNLDRKYKELQGYHIYTNDLKKTEYKGENQRALSIYLEDWEEKTAVYDDLLTKLNLFVGLLNNKGLSNKKAAVKANSGFVFMTMDEQELELSTLSSGEQNETILLYELLFKAESDSLVLIDEPETSMHVAWQYEFIPDLKKIISVNPLSFLIVTHSPDIINDQNPIDLYELIHGESDADE
jgi:ABC-type Mn2+/Zn2+ transport system ATPase subunit